MFFHQNKNTIICIGSISQDIFFPTDEGQIIKTPEDLTSKEKIAFELGGKIRVAERYESIGGVAANVSIGLARLGHPSACYSKVGADDMGRNIHAILKHEKVGTHTLFDDQSVKTDLSAIIVLTQSGERTIFHNRDANDKLEIVPERLKDAAWYFVSALNGPWEDNLKRILELAKVQNVRVGFNPGQHNIKGNPKLVLEAIGQAEVVVLNKDEAIELLMKGESVPSAPRDLDSEAYLLKRLHEQGAHVIGMTDGERGAWAYDGNALLHCAPHHGEKVVDTTGAGDAFGSGFFSAYLAERPLGECLAWGTANAGSVLTRYGATPGLLNLVEMESAVKSIASEPLPPYSKPTVTPRRVL